MSETAADVEFFQGEVIALHAGTLSVEVAVDTDRLANQYGPRFDRSAQVVQVHWGERAFLAEQGLPDEYGLWGHGVLGFEADAPRDAPDEFVKVGVGRLHQNVPGSFKPFQDWLVVELARNVVTERASDRITVEQTLPGKVWSYRQTKTYVAQPDGSLTIHYTLENLGSEPIPVEHYNHNFFVAPADQRVTVHPTFPAPEPPLSGPWELEPDGIFLNAAKLRKPYRAWEWSPESGTAENLIEVRWSDGSSASITGDFPVHRFALWAKDEMMCPEIFYRTEVAPGQSVKWQRSYRFGAIAIDR